jgi:flagellar biosynthesis protein FlhA
MKRADLIFTGGLFITVLLLIMPIPTILLDTFLALNIGLSLLVLLAIIYIKDPPEFSAFPTLLLALTLFRLALNISSTRQVLINGYAGQVIDAFGHFVIQGNYIVGAVVFLILVVINFVVITKGAGRIAEVSARFTLDALPGKQMAIDAELNAGIIDEVTATARRVKVQKEADFYGAMDGASKFVKGDAIAGILIIVINVVGGIAIGMIQRGMQIGDAVNSYTLLTIGDGLVSQIPALLMAVSTGMIVTRSNAESDMGTTASNQLSQSRNALMIAGCAAIVLALIPGMPPIPFVLVGAFLVLASQRIKTAQAAAKKTQAAQNAVATATKTETTEDLIEQMRIHALEITLAPDLVDIVSGASDDLLARVRALRRKIALELGVIVPPVRTRDSADLPPSTYVIKVAGVEGGRGQAPSGRVLALGDALDTLPGTPTVEPVFGLPAKWIPSEMRHSAELGGATVIDRVSVLITHLSSIVTANAARLLTREDVRLLTEGVKQINPPAVEELIPALLSLAEVQRVLQGLLAEQVAINDLPRILEALTLRAKMSNDPEGLVEAARAALGPAVVAPHLDAGTLRVVMIDPGLEQSMLEGLRPSESGTQIVLDPVRLEAVLASIRDTAGRLDESGVSAVLVCAPALRPAIRRMVAGQLAGLAVLSYQEVTAVQAAIETVGVVRGAESIAA